MPSLENISEITDALTRIGSLKLARFDVMPFGGPRSGFYITEYEGSFPDTYAPATYPDVYITNDVVMDNLIPYALAGVKALKALSDATNATVSGHTSSLSSQASSIVTLSSAIAALPSIYLSQTISSEGNLGTLTWSGTAPGGTVTKKYRWSQTGKIVTLDWLVKASTPGLLVSSLSVPLPGDAPAPSPLSNVANDSWVCMGAGSILATASANILSGQAGLYKNSGGTYELRNTTTASLGASVAQGQVQYLTA